MNGALRVIIGISCILATGTSAVLVWSASGLGAAFYLAVTVVLGCLTVCAPWEDA